MIALKMFEAGGKKVRPGDDVSKFPADVLAQYERNGLVGPKETKPAAPKETKTDKKQK